MEKVLEVKNLSIAFGGLKAVDDLSFTVNEGDIYGLIGPNGAGKTTAFNCITQFYLPNAGEVIFKTNKGMTKNLVGEKVHDVITHGLVRTFQNLELIKELSLEDNLLLGAHIKFKTNILQHAFRTKKAREEERVLREKAVKILEFLGIAHLKDAPASGQPYGVLKKVELGRTLMSDPTLIVLDEPAAGLNDAETLDLAKLIKDIRREYSCSILLIEHDMRLVMSICDRLCVISFGKKIIEGTPSEVQAHPEVQAAYLGKED